jgi:hypothetical protein
VFDSQVLEVAIGLVLAFFLLATVSSAVIEVISAVVRKRAKDLEVALNAMLSGSSSEVHHGRFWDWLRWPVAGDGAEPDPTGSPARVQDTSTFKGLTAGVKPLLRRESHPSYLSAKAFADAVTEIIIKAKAGVQTGQEQYEQLPEGLRNRLQPIVEGAKADATAIKSELESWFDETMARVEGSYKRWSQLALFIVGLAIVIGCNASAYHMAATLYKDPAIRSAVTASATSIAKEGATSEEATGTIGAVESAVDQMSSLSLPIGWNGMTWSGDDAWWRAPGELWARVFGWLATALLIMLGAPFWYELLTRLVSLRSAGARPPEASDDPTSATGALLARAKTQTEAATPSAKAGAAVAATQAEALAMVPRARHAADAVELERKARAVADAMDRLVAKAEDELSKAHGEEEQAAQEQRTEAVKNAEKARQAVADAESARDASLAAFLPHLTAEVAVATAKASAEAAERPRLLGRKAGQSAAAAVDRAAAEAEAAVLAAGSADELRAKAAARIPDAWKEDLYRAF